MDITPVNPYPRETELTNRLVALVAEYDDELSYSAVVGSLEIVKQLFVSELINMEIEE